VGDHEWEITEQEDMTMELWPKGLHAGKSLTHPFTGQTVTLLELSPELLVMETTYQAGGRLAPEHFHPAQTEHFVCLEGAVRVVVNGRPGLLEQGDDLTLPPRTPHRFGGRADSAGRVRWEVRPALRTAELLGTTFGLAQDGLTTRAGIPPLLRSVQIAREFDAELQLTQPPRLVQRVAFAVLGGVAELRNVRGLYVPGSSS
jgi:quercetin dioxygenase-like cupin family protein